MTGRLAITTEKLTKRFGDLVAVRDLDWRSNAVRSSVFPSATQPSRHRVDDAYAATRLRDRSRAAGAWTRADGVRQFDNCRRTRLPKGAHSARWGNLR